MKAVILNGARPEEAACIDDIEKQLMRLLAQAGWQAQTVRLREANLACCLGCLCCWTATPGICRIDDDGRALAARVIGSHLVVCLTPVTFGGYSAPLKRAIDRLLPLLSPFFRFVAGEVHHQRRYEQSPRILGVGVLAMTETSGEEGPIFSELVARNAINFDSPISAAGIIAEGSVQFLEGRLQSLLTRVGVAA